MRTTQASRVAATAVVAMAVALLGSGCVRASGDGEIRSKGGAGPSVPEAFAEMDRLLEERIRVIGTNAAQLHRSLTVQYRAEVLDHLVPELKRRASEARSRAAEAMSSDASRRAARLSAAGVHYECATVASQVLLLELAMVHMAEWADEKGQSSWQIAGTLRAFDADMKSLMEAARALDRPRLVAALESSAPKFNQWHAYLDRWSKAIGVGETWSRWGYLVGDVMMLAISAHELAALAAEGANLGPPPLVAVGAGGAAAASRVSAEVFANALEAIEKLIASGALDSAVVAGIGALGHQMAASGNGPKQMEMPLGVPTEPGPRDTTEPAPTVEKINGRNPRNYTYADKIFTAKDLPPELRAKYPRGVAFTPDGCPDFRGYMLREVKLEGVKGEGPVDFRRANEAAGLKKTPEGYIWHHHQDGRTMQLVPQDLHDAIEHTGGAAKVRGGSK